MKEMSFGGLMLVKMQANLFYNYYKYAKCSPHVFVRRFMFSHLASKFDNYQIAFESSSDRSMIEEINEEYGETTFGKLDENDLEKLFWAGYLYRYFAFTYEISSKEIYHKLPLNKLFDRYYIFHSMDIGYAIERIIEEENIVFDERKDIKKLIQAHCKKNLEGK